MLLSASSSRAWQRLVATSGGVVVMDVLASGGYTAL